jgi:hypothetical protein
MYSGISEARDHILILNILFFNKLWQIIPEVRSEMWDLLIFIFMKIHEKYNFRIIFYVSLIKNDEQKKEKKLTFFFKSLARSGQRF